MSFENLKLDARLMRALTEARFSAPTPIQSAAIPVALEGRDLMACAQTGTGKTAAFALPLLQRLLSSPARAGIGPRALVLTPTRELAGQVMSNIEQLGRFCRLTAAAVVGGVAYGPQLRQLRQALDVLVATPGRLLDHMQTGRVDLTRVEVFVLDEADRMLDMGFVHAVNTIAAKLPQARQTLLFSATLEGKVAEVARRLLRQPSVIRLTTSTERHANIAQRIHRANDRVHKRALLGHLLVNEQMRQAVIFAGTKRGADKLAKALSADGHTAAALHGDMTQAARRRVVERMRAGALRVLVATDVAARGLDIAGISHVINFDLPPVPEDYIHRVGRTGRAGATGTAISLVEQADMPKLAAIERLLARKIERLPLDGVTVVVPARWPEPATPAPARRAHGRNAARQGFSGKAAGRQRRAFGG